MPHIEEKDLVAMHDRIEHSEKYLEKFENFFYEERKKSSALKKQRNIFIAVSCLFLCFLLFGGISYFMNTSDFVDKNYLDENGLKLYQTVYVDSLENEIEALKLEHQDVLNANTFYENNKQASLENATIYAVQIGAFEDRMISMTSESLINLKQFKESGFYKYAVGQFDNLAEAQQFRKELLNIGFNDAFIASYENGRRIRIEEIR
jgi:hypothetical protein